MTHKALDTRQLKHVLELDKYKNFHRAAEALCISQPALTKSIKNLESTLGVILFDRHADGIAATPYCEVILQHARRVLLELDEMSHRLDSMLELRGGELRLGSGPIMAESVLADPIRVLLDELPELKVEIVVDDWSNLPRLLRQGALHLFVVDVARLRDEPDLEVIPLGIVENIFVCRAGHPLAGGGAVTPRDFLEFSLALPKMTNRLWTWLIEHAPDLASLGKYRNAIHRIECQSVPLLRRLVQDSNYITGGPRKLFEKEIAEGTLVELQMKQCNVLFSEPSISYLKGRTLPPAAQRFIDIVTQRESPARHGGFESPLSRQSV